MIFIDNKYTKIYYQIIDRAKLEVRSKKDCYFENHHIIPRCMDGKETVLLTAREHFLCHWLLCKMVEGEKKYKIFHAFSSMSLNSRKLKRKYTSRQYEIMRKYLSVAASYKMLGQTAWNKGKKCSVETKEKMKFAKLGKSKTPEHKLAMSLAQKERRKNYIFLKQLTIP